MNFCLSDLVPPLRWSDATRIRSLQEPVDRDGLPDAWWRSLPIGHVLAALDPERLADLLTELAVEHWPAAAIGDILPALHVLDPDEADEPHVAIALDRVGSWTGLLSLTGRELLDQPFIQARPVVSTLFAAVFTRLTEARGIVRERPDAAERKEPVGLPPAMFPPAGPASFPPASASFPPSIVAPQPSASRSEAAASGGGKRDPGDLPALIDAAFSDLDDQAWAVAQNRVFTDDPSEVEQLAKLFAVAPERIEELEERLRERLAEWLAGEDAAPYNRHIEAVARELGVAAPKSRLIEAADWHVRELRSLDIPAWQFVLATLPGYRVADGWLVAGDLDELHEKTRELIASAERPPTVARALELVATLGIHPDVAKEWLESVPRLLIQGSKQRQEEDAPRPPEDLPDGGSAPDPVSHGLTGDGSEDGPPAEVAPPAPDVSAPHASAPEVSAPEVSAPEVSAPDGPDLLDRPEPGPRDQREPGEPDVGRAEPLPDAAASEAAAPPGPVQEPPGRTDDAAAVPGDAEPEPGPGVEPVAPPPKPLRPPYGAEPVVPAAEERPSPAVDAPVESPGAPGSGGWADRPPVPDPVNGVGPGVGPFGERPGEVPIAAEGEADGPAPAPQLDLPSTPSRPTPPSGPGAGEGGPAEPRLDAPSTPSRPVPPVGSGEPAPPDAPGPPGDALGGSRIDLPSTPSRPVARDGEPGGAAAGQLKDVALTRRCFRQPDGRWWFRVDITEDHLAGGPCAIPSGFAAYLGLTPGESRTVRCATGEMTLSWQPRPALDAIRPLLLEAGARAGGHLFVTLTDDGTLRARHLPATSGAEKTAQALRLVGYTAPGGTMDQALRVIATRVGMNGSASRSDLLARLRERGDRDLLSLLATPVAH